LLSIGGGIGVATASPPRWSNASSALSLRGVSGIVRGGGGIAPGGRNVTVAPWRGMSTSVGIGGR
jgi:hypothetical protein